MTTRYRRSPAAIWRASAQVLVAAVPPNAPTRMAGSAALVWRYLEDAVGVEELAGFLAAATGSEAGVVHADVQALLDALVPLGLVEQLP